MTARHRSPETDPRDQPAPPIVSHCQNTPTERDQARDAIVARATNMRDLGQLLAALGLDHPAEITTQLAHQGDR